MNVTKQRYTVFGVSVTPLPATKRHVPGGAVIDVRIHDERSTTTYATVNVLHVIDRQGRPWSYQ